MEEVAVKQVNGAVHSLGALVADKKSKVVAAINNQIRLFELTNEMTLQSDSPYSGNIVALYLDVSKNGFILVGDLMRSMSGKANFCMGSDSETLDIFDKIQGFLWEFSCDSLFFSMKCDFDYSLSSSVLAR